MANARKELQTAIKHIDRAAEICAKYGMALGNGGDIASMLISISGELANGDAYECEDLKD